MTRVSRPVRDPSTLARPRMWSAPPPGEQAQGFTSVAPPTGGRHDKGPAWVAVTLMAAGVVLCGVAVGVQHWQPLVVGLLVGAVGIVLAARARIMEDVSTSDDPEHDG